MFSDPKDKALIFKRKSLSAGGSSRWLTSFGDLLTLLLCFFICIVSLSRENPPTDQPSQNVMPRNSKRYDISQAGAQSSTPGGTTIAFLKHKPERVTLHFGRDDFEISGERLSSQAVSWMKNAIFVEGYKVMPQEITACGHSGSPQESADWYRAMQRVFDLRGQLIDAQVSTRGLALQVLGSDCSTLRSQGTGSESAVAAVSLIYKRES